MERFAGFEICTLAATDASHHPKLLGVAKTYEDALLFAASEDLLDVAQVILDAANDRTKDGLGHELPPAIRKKLEAAIARTKP